MMPKSNFITLSAQKMCYVRSRTLFWAFSMVYMSAVSETQRKILLTLCSAISFTIAHTLAVNVHQSSELRTRIKCGKELI
jgi:hypothetical protein